MVRFHKHLTHLSTDTTQQDHTLRYAHSIDVIYHNIYIYIYNTQSTQTYTKTHTTHTKPTLSGTPRYHVCVYRYVCVCVSVYIDVCLLPPKSSLGLCVCCVGCGLVMGRWWRVMASCSTSPPLHYDTSVSHIDLSLSMW